MIPGEGQVEESSPSLNNNINFNNCEYDYFDWDDNGDDDYKSPLLHLDDNGFPPHDAIITGNGDNPDNGNVTRIEEDDGDGSFASDFYNPDNGNETRIEEDDGDGSFASDFYGCGTDCSSLLQQNQTSSSSKNLKQRDLFQIWGLKKPSSHDHDVVNVDTSLHSPPPPNKKVKVVNNLRGFVSSHDSGNNSTKSKAVRTRKWSNSGSDNNRPRICPFYKKLPGTPFTVDAFRYGSIEGCSAYFLTHFHADHYGGLTKGWSHGPIYCTPITARLLRICLYVNPSFIHPLELDTEHVIEGIRVTMLEANHCPGAALIYFRLPNGQCYLHTGDFRASKLMQTYPLLVNRRVNVLYLDTTYCNSKYKFPSKEDVLSFVVKVTKNWLKKQPKTLVIVGAYSIGKECVYLAISKALEVKVFANSSRRRILQSFGWPEISENLCSNGKDTPLHVLPMSHLRFETLEEYLKAYVGQYKAVLAFRPTGWTYSETIGNQLDLMKPRSRGNVTIYGVPYSEHSSFTELREFVQFLKPDKIIPTVNVGSAATRDKMQSNFREWLKG